jgi:hypothetical protein
MAGPEEWGATPVESGEGPSAWGAKPADRSKEFEPGEPTFAEEFMHGLSSPIRGAMQLGGIERAKAQTHPDKIPQREPDELSPGAVAGQIANPMNWVAPGASMATKLGPLARGAITGGVTGFLQPVKDGENFWSTKGEQAASGLALGYGFSLGGKAAGAGINKLGEWLMGTYPDALHNKAVALVIDKISKNRQGMTATDAIDLVRAANKGMSRGKNARMMTLSDLKELNRLGGTVYRKSDEGYGMATKLYGQRDAQAGARLRSEVAKHIQGGETMFETTQALLEARSAAAAPLYEKTDGLQGIWSPYLKDLFELPEIKEGMKRGFDSERIRAAADARPFNPTMMGVDIRDPNDIKFLRSPNMRVLDMAKRGLDEMIANERNEFTGRLSSRGLDLELLRRGYLKELDKLDITGTYKAARDAWSGPSRSLDAMKQGSSIFQTHPEETASIVSKMTPNEKQFFLIGVADKVTEKILKTGLSADEAKHIANSEWAKMQLRPAFDSDKDFNRFMNSVATENKMFSSMRSIAGGSKTAESVSSDDQFMQEVIDPTIQIAQKTLHGRIGSAAVDALRMFKDLGTIRHQKEMADEVAKIIFQPLSPTAAKAHSVLEMRPVPQPGNVVKEATPFLAPGVGAAVPNEDMLGGKPESQ